MVGTNALGTKIIPHMRPQEESERLNAALKQEGCSGGKMEFEERQVRGRQRRVLRWQDV
jgi:hypothetical protein